MTPLTHKKVRPYGLWQSSVTIESLVAQASPPSYPFKNNGMVYWLEAQHRDNSRIAVMQENPSGDPICITPQPFNIRTVVHEYGGRCFCVIDNHIIFNNYNDGVLYRQLLRPGSEPQQVSDNAVLENCCGYADLVAVNNKKFIVGVVEVAGTANHNHNSIMAIALRAGSERGQTLEAEPIILVQGADFYANPVISPDGKNIAWIEWSHPNMPWDQSRLVCARLRIAGGKIAIDDPEVIVDEENRSVCQLGFLNDARLIFASDSDACNYWNLFAYFCGKITQLTQGNVEFGEAHWLFGQRRWQAVNDGKIIASITKEDGDSLVEVNPKTGGYAELYQGFSACTHLQIAEPDEVLLVSHHANKPPEINSFSTRSGRLNILSVNLSNTDCVAQKQDCSKPVLIKFPTESGDIAYGYYYAPYNSLYSAPTDTLPPLMILIHGGPTSRATTEFSGLKQYYCSLGFALLDINHHGSTGYGREFRQSLLGNWGKLDTNDIADAIEFVVAKKWVDKDLIFIRGSSAGGYAVLRSLTRFSKLFAGGACYYGIGNLITLSKITHKFEARYTDRLVGENFSPISSAHPSSRFVTRSPVFQIDKLSSPLILFQGENDKIVPPSLSREVVALLQAKGIKHSYTEYPGEGHGFRQTWTKMDSLHKEITFFAEIISKNNQIDKINENADEYDRHA